MTDRQRLYGLEVESDFRLHPAVPAGFSRGWMCGSGWVRTCRERWSSRPAERWYTSNTTSRSTPSPSSPMERNFCGSTVRATSRSARISRMSSSTRSLAGHRDRSGPRNRRSACLSPVPAWPPGPARQRRRPRGPIHGVRRQCGHGQVDDGRRDVRARGEADHR